MIATSPVIQAYGLCECGCGGLAPVAASTDRKRGYIKGQPRRFIRGHHAFFTRAELVAVSETDKAWAAGVFDGEGTVYVTPRRQRTFALIVSVGQSSAGPDPAPMLLKLRSHFGGSLSLANRPGRLLHHVWALSCQSAEDYLRQIVPYVVQKREQVDLALAYRERLTEGALYRRLLQEAKR